MEREKKIIEIPGLPEGSYAVIKKFKGGEASKIRNSAIKVSISMKTGEQTAGDVNMYEMAIGMLTYGVKEASFLKVGVTENEKRKYFEEELDSEPFDYLFKEINMFNKASEVLQKK